MASTSGPGGARCLGLAARWETSYYSWETENTLDTQWPLFEVFEQDGPGQPARHTGRLRAPDAEQALQAARQVFERRTECTAVWLVPRTHIYAWTAAALKSDPSWQTDTVVLTRSASPYEVFANPGAGQSSASPTHVGSVEARSPTEALRRALSSFDTPAIEAWWLVPSRAILRATR